ncbi:MAG: hypothetical protein AKCLJLPJ_01225 [Fimbriimonadales bacterium]|nr:MAG: SUF system Fe-S cluster assembly protein [Armatimonadota bacterium]MBV6503161.1 hypothetical protein [Fimbriimonadales bacterium]MCE7900894.1 SUF system Fe-S cluster assembly protein [Armatimonadetes bacterium ATM1]MDL1929678.1 SUF system Fe-S cluster assembly protein [Fimbriimonadia bacterium ATM]MBC6970755.1 SUF system Fe-S cluster assembly protein [Armatimonadota bacterium]
MSDPLADMKARVLEGEVIEAIRTVYDPEIPVNLYDLGLIYDIQIDEQKNVYVKMTLTTPMCPVAGQMPGEVEHAVRSVPDVNDVKVELVWDPPWDMSRIPEEVRMDLGLL